MSSRSGQGKDKNRTLVHNDSIENAVSVIDEMHRRVHRGELFTWSSGAISIPASSTLVVGIFPTDLEDYHMRVRGALGGLSDGRLEIYEDANVVPDGATSLANNHNRAAQATNPTPLIEFGTATFFSGTQLFDTIIPPTVAFRTKEWIMSPASADGIDAAVILTNFNTSAVNGSINITFYQDTGIII